MDGSTPPPGEADNPPTLSAEAPVASPRSAFGAVFHPVRAAKRFVARHGGLVAAALWQLAVAKARQHLPRLIGPVLLNIALAAASWFYLGGVSGWDAPGRAAANLYAASALSFAQFLVLGALANRIFKVVFIDSTKPRHEQQIPALAIHLTTGFIYVVAISAGYKLVFGQSLGTVLAASGVVGLVLGFALRGLLSDIFSGISLHLDSTFRNGDLLRIVHRGAEIEATLINFEWRCAVLHDKDANAVLIPNGEFSQMRVINLTSPDPYSWYNQKMSVSVDRPPAFIIPILKNAADRAAQDGAVLKTPAPSVFVSDTMNGMTDYTIRYALSPTLNRRVAKDRVLRFALQFLNAAGVSLVPLSYQGTIETSNDDALSNNFALAQVRSRVLGNVPFFSALNHDELAYIAEHTTAQRHPGGTKIIIAGAAGESMFLVLEGRLDVVINTDNGPISVASMWPGDCFGEMSLFTGAPRTATIVALERVQLIEITKDIMAELFRRNIHLAHAVAEVIEARTQATRKTLDNLNKATETQEDRTETLFGKILAFFKL